MSFNDHLLRVKRLTPTARLPTRGSAGAAGYDLYADLPGGRAEIGLMARGDIALIGTGIAVRLPPGHYGRIAPRSGLGARGVIVLGGVVDSDYTGELKVILMRMGPEALFIRPGDRIAQLVLERIATPDVLEVDCLEATARGEKGFGSSGA